MNAYVIELSPISNHNKAHLIRYLIGMGWGIYHTHHVCIRYWWTAKWRYRYFSSPIFKRLILNLPIPWFIWSDSFSASSSPKILDVVLNYGDAYPKNHRELNWGYVRIVSDLRQNFLSVGRHLGIGFITNFITTKHDQKVGYKSILVGYEVGYKFTF